VGKDKEIKSKLGEKEYFLEYNIDQLNQLTRYTIVFTNTQNSQLDVTFAFKVSKQKAEQQQLTVLGSDQNEEDALDMQIEKSVKNIMYFYTEMRFQRMRT
jgi:hypothetical protein